VFNSNGRGTCSSGEKKKLCWSENKKEKTSGSVDVGGEKKIRGAGKFVEPQQKRGFSICGPDGASVVTR